MAMAKTAPSTPRLTRTSLAAEDAAFTPRTRRSYQALGITPVVIKTWGGGTAVSIAHRTAKEDNTPEPVKAPKATPAIKEPVKAPKTTPATKANKPSVSSSSKPRPATAPTEPAANPTGKARLPAIPPPDNSDELPAGTTVDKSRIGADKGGLKRVVSDKGATPAAPPAKKPRKAQSTSKAVPSKPTQSSSKAKKSAPAHETTTPTAVSNHKNVPKPIGNSAPSKLSRDSKQNPNLKHEDKIPRSTPKDAAPSTDHETRELSKAASPPPEELPSSQSRKVTLDDALRILPRESLEKMIFFSIVEAVPLGPEHVAEELMATEAIS